MKKLLILILLSISICSNATVNKYGRYGKCIVNSPTYNQEGTFISDSLIMQFYEYNGFVNISIKNNNNNRIYIEWENARIGNSKVIFETDDLYSIEKPKSDECVISGNQSETRNISGYDMVHKYNSEIYPLSGKFMLTLPIRFSNRTIDYKIELEIRKSN